MSLPRTTDYPCHSSSPRQTDSVEFHWDQSNNVFLKATEDGQHASIVLDRAQVQSLRNELTSWLGGGLSQSALQPHPEPIAWMVGTAFWWTKEEAERDAAATGLPIVGLGPMTDAGEVNRLRAERRRMDEALVACANERDELRKANTDFEDQVGSDFKFIDDLRAQLAELQSSVREFLRIDGISVDGSAARNKALTMLNAAVAGKS